MKRIAMSISIMLKRQAYLASAIALTITALAVVMITAGRAQGPVNQGPSAHHSLPIGATTVFFTRDQMPWDQVIRAFIQTESESQHCLATLGDAVDGWNIRTVFCAPRTFNGAKGIMVSVFLNNPVPEGAEVYVELTLYQEGASGYGQPVLYTGD
jgi:hypothetical protein